MSEQAHEHEPPKLEGEVLRWTCSNGTRQVVTADGGLWTQWLPVDGAEWATALCSTNEGRRRLAARLAAVERDLATAHELLLKLEWSAPGQTCGACGGNTSLGHQLGCPTGRALANYGAGKGAGTTEGT